LGDVNHLRIAISIFYCLAALLTGWASANVTVDGDLTRLFDTHAGAVITDELELRNPGDTDAQVHIYLTDYAFSADGTSEYPEPGTLDRSNTEWMSLNTAPVVVPARGSVQLPYSIEVPDDADAGSFWSVIMVEQVQPAPEAGDGLTLTTVVRYGVQVVTTLSGAPAELSFVNPAFTSVDGTSQLTVDIENTGLVSLRAGHYVDLFDSAGEALGRFEGAFRRIHPGTSVRQSFELGSLAAGSYVAVVVADAGGENVFGAQYNLNVNP